MCIELWRINDDLPNPWVLFYTVAKAMIALVSHNMLIAVFKPFCNFIKVLELNKLIYTVFIAVFTAFWIEKGLKKLIVQLKPLNA